MRGSGSGSGAGAGAGTVRTVLDWAIMSTTRLRLLGGDSGGWSGTGGQAGGDAGAYATGVSPQHEQASMNTQTSATKESPQTTTTSAVESL